MDNFVVDKCGLLDGQDSSHKVFVLIVFIFFLCKSVDTIDCDHFTGRMALCSKAPLGHAHRAQLVSVLRLLVCGP